MNESICVFWQFWKCEPYVAWTALSAIGTIGATIIALLATIIAPLCIWSRYQIKNIKSRYLKVFQCWLSFLDNGRLFLIVELKNRSLFPIVIESVWLNIGTHKKYKQKLKKDGKYCNLSLFFDASDDDDTQYGTPSNILAPNIRVDKAGFDFVGYSGFDSFKILQEHIANHKKVYIKAEIKTNIQQYNYNLSRKNKKDVIEAVSKYIKCKELQEIIKVKSTKKKK
jgi:hypothetical protein